MKIIIDTNVYAELARGNEHVRRILENADVVFVPVAVLGELHAGFNMGSRTAENRRQLEDFLDLPGVVTVSLDSSVAERYGELVSLLKKNGTPLPTNDVWIGATALETGGRMMTFDSHYKSIPGLMMVL